jgi:hypothetical protein
VTIGVPFARGLITSISALRLEGDDSSVRPLQARPLDLWPDGGVRWALLDFTADVKDGVLAPLVLGVSDALPSPPAGTQPASVKEIPDGVRVETGAATFDVRRGTPFPLARASVGGADCIDAAASGVRIGHRGRIFTCSVREIEVVERGPLRVEIAVHARLSPATELRLEVFGRLEFFAGTSTVRLSLRLRNPRRARHPGGIWELGDRGSLLLDSATLVLELPAGVTDVRVASERGGALAGAVTPFDLYQDSSGGERWNHRAHVNRQGALPLTFRGYRQRSGPTEHGGLRASPVLVASTAASEVAIAVPAFWENCPRSIGVRGRTVEVGFFPGAYGDVYELQGGEQKTHLCAIAFGPDRVSSPPLAWCHEPLRVYADSDYCCATDAVPFLSPAGDDDARYRRLVAAAFDPERGFLAKRERFDEYGWRHFGDIPGDHESAFQPEDRPFTSHYNNQYDAIAAFATHFLRSGDSRWWRLMDDLARHVVDIDIYHTHEDKAAYNGGLFWHTQHYVDAGRSTHRTYPRGTGGGGPSAEHNYNVGLMLHYFMTGEPASRDAAMGLGQWVIDMDDGRRTPFRWLSSAPTGLASATGSISYHGPGRGAANSILACMTAHRLSGDRAFVDKAEELIRRCIHPLDDLERRRLFDVERRWYYTVFLQVLGMYLYDKAERAEIDAMYLYARAGLLHYARWIARYERPYLERADLLEYPTETWVAQDIRKADALWWAARHADDAEREVLSRRARFFFEYVVDTLMISPSRHFARPLVILLSNGWRVSAMHATGLSRSPQSGRSTSGPFYRSVPRFEPQRRRAVRSLLWMAGVVVVAATLLLVSSL